MRRARAVIVFAFLLALPGSSAAEIDGETDRVSYSLGQQVGSDLADQGVDIDADALLQGLVDGLGGSDPELPPDQIRKLLVELKRGIRDTQRRRALGQPTRERAADPEKPPGS